MLDLVIRGGTVADGTLAKPRRADVGIRAGRIAAIGEIVESARRELDARGKVVSPGFVDIHTHYDAQVFWDPTLSPSSFHGVTTVVGGNCGFSIAPLSPGAGDYLIRMLARVEGMPLESLQAGVPWDWTSFGDYLDRIENRLAVNAGFLVGHSALRRVVMGERAVGEKATQQEMIRMVALLRESVAGGGLGFSSSRAITHSDGDGRPVPSRHASPEELVALAASLRDCPGTTLELLPRVGVFTEEDRELMAAMSAAANRPLNWNLLVPTSQRPDMTEAQLSASDYAAKRGGRVYGLTIPSVGTLRINLRTGFLFDALPGWASVIGLPLEERMRAFSDPVVRERLKAGAESEATDPFFKAIAAWAGMTIAEAFSENTKPLEGRQLGDIGRELGTDPFDVMLDVALADGLRTSFAPFRLPADDEETWRLRALTWKDPRAVVGGSDAGAHLDMIDTFSFSTQLLQKGMRERGLVTLEEAVHALTDVPARLYGLRERGRLEEGWRADVVVFDPDRIAVGPLHTRYDLPAGAGRLYAAAEGIEHVFVNGVEIVRGEEFTGSFPGTVLRSGRDTETVTASPLA